jgi:hypothetical protein
MPWFCSPGQSRRGAVDSDQADEDQGVENFIAALSRLILAAATEGHDANVDVFEMPDARAVEAVKFLR